MKISIGSDHHGYQLKQAIIEHFSHCFFIDVGTDGPERVDYPDFAHQVCHNILNSTTNLGILLCGTGIGMSITANRYPGIFAGLCWNPEVAQLAKAHDHINVLVLPADFLDQKTTIKIIEIWIKTTPLEGTYQTRLEKIDLKNK